MLTLLTFGPSFEMPSHSPFCVKAMALLHLSGQDWQPKYLSDPRKMPLGRLPVLKTAEGRLIPDSAHIQAYLEAEGAAFDAGLSAQDKARSHALIRMVEGHLAAGMAHDRWLRDECWPEVREAFFNRVPRMMRGPVSGMIRRKVRAAMMINGIAQFSEEERLARLAQDLETISTTLGTGPFLFGERPTAADAAIAPVLDMIRTLPCDTGLRRLVRGSPALMGYIKRARAALYPM
ncbi:glutathione S-transferase family protein [Roseovarius faecimaris]|uniref:Glutathione S-transferase family protein n=1 Tax=Roseovarius faecimaris TaxID=2494550 RepID=A0A6I6IX18_9RHOB|nr:glutathione S-transferase family protein [Roseovarius faecimaris]QGX99967.1 glutathione S-transferase family protein [Roseovarius faecimaris]